MRQWSALQMEINLLVYIIVFDLSTQLLDLSQT